MGYRFTLESANTVANLTFGKINSCFNDIFSSEENYYNFLEFVEKFNNYFYSSIPEDNNYVVKNIEKILHRYYDYVERYENNDFRISNGFYRFQEDVFDALSAFSQMLRRCKIRSLLLPRIGLPENRNDDYILSEETFRNLMQLHPGDSCLVLQPQTRPRIAALFDVFPNFDIALKNVDLWPAVFFWDDNGDYVFVPLDSEMELYNLYLLVKYDSNPLIELKRRAMLKRMPRHYIFQLSDLHFGASGVENRRRRLNGLIKKQMQDFEPGDSVEFLITGDSVDSPNGVSENLYKDFAENICGRYGKYPIRILGNHDINYHGLAIFHGRQRLSRHLGYFPRIEFIEDTKIILLLFNSNTNGNLAEGEIGESQMIEMGNLLDNITELKKYSLIAVLHHHIISIPTPDFYKRKWYEKVVPVELIDDCLKLRDADVFVEWLRSRNVRCVLHGHKHIPFTKDYNGIHVISCGSSTGNIVHKVRGKTYMSYNVLKVGEESIACMMYAEEVGGSGAKNICSEILNL